MKKNQIMENRAILNKDVNLWRNNFTLNNEKVLQLLEEFLGIRETQGMAKQVNRGKLAEMWLQKQIGLRPTFDKISQFDFIKDGKKCQFKYLGQNSSPSVSEAIRKNMESDTKFINRIMKYYQDCEVFVLSLQNNITSIKWENCIVMDKTEFKSLIREQAKTVKDGNKMRLRKTVVRRVTGS